MAKHLSLIPAATADLPAALAPDLDKAAALARQEKAEATRRAYGSDFGIFESWCRQRGISALPATAESVAAFLACEVAKGARPSTIGRRVAAIRYAHRLAGHPLPTDDERVKATVRGIRRSLGTAPRKKSPATAERVIAMAVGTGDGLKGLRDRALLLLGFAGAFRRSELVALDCEDIEECDTGIKITIRRSKTDQEGAGATIAIVRGSIACPVAAVRAWRTAAGIATGPLFPSDPEGRQDRRAAVGAVRRRDHQGARRARRARALAVRRPQPARWLPDISGEAWSLDFQDDGREPPPLG
jgi:integrase